MFSPYLNARGTGHILRLVKIHPQHLGLGHNRQIRSLQHGPQKATGTAPAAATFLVYLKVAVAEVVTAIELVDFGYPGLRCSITPGIKNFPVDAPLLHSQLTTGTVISIGAMLVVFRLLEHRQHIIPAPASITQGRPVIIITALAAHINHGINGGATAQHLTPGITDAAAVQARLGFRGITPVSPRIVDGVEITHRDINPEIVVLAACLQQQHPVLRVPGQAVGQHTAGAAAADNDVIICVHKDLPARSVEIQATCNRL